MTSPPFIDAGNPLLKASPAQLETGTIGHLGAVTVRTPTTTLTVLLNAGDVKTWAAVLAGLAATMSGSGLSVVSAADGARLGVMPPGGANGGGGRRTT